jgi:hypothetical protein
MKKSLILLIAGICLVSGIASADDWEASAMRSSYEQVVSGDLETVREVLVPVMNVMRFINSRDVSWGEIAPDANRKFKKSIREAYGRTIIKMQGVISGDEARKLAECSFKLYDMGVLDLSRNEKEEVLLLVLAAKVREAGVEENAGSIVSSHQEWTHQVSSGLRKRTVKLTLNYSRVDSAAFLAAALGLVCVLWWIRERSLKRS